MSANARLGLETSRAAGAAPAAPAAVNWIRFGFQAAVMGGLIALLYWHVLYMLVRKWLDNPDWSHGFLIPVFSVYYLYMQRDRLPRTMIRTGWPALVILLAAFELYLYGSKHHYAYFSTISLVIAIFGTIYLLCGWPVARWAWFAVAFLFFALPLPGGIYNDITMPLQEIASTAGAVLLNLVPGMDAQAEHIVISYLYKGTEGELNIEQACSGIRLMMAFVALGIAMAYASERPLWHRMVMILACIPIAILCNMIRVTTTGLFVVFDRPEYARGIYHTLLGLSMLVIAFSLFGLISYVLSNLFVEAKETSERKPAGPAPAAQER